VRDVGVLWNLPLAPIGGNWFYDRQLDAMLKIPELRSAQKRKKKLPIVLSNRQFLQPRRTVCRRLTCDSDSAIRAKNTHWLSAARPVRVWDSLGYVLVSGIRASSLRDIRGVRTD